MFIALGRSLRFLRSLPTSLPDPLRELPSPPLAAAFLARPHSFPSLPRAPRAAARPPLAPRSFPPPRPPCSAEHPVPAAYNIIPIQDVVMHGGHPSLRFPEVRAAVEALAHAADLPAPPLARAWDAFRADLFDWLGATLGFQPHNVRNQQEHLVLLLANAQLRAADGEIAVLGMGIHPSKNE